MAQLLNDQALKTLLGSVIIDGEESSIRPNSYILRLGTEGEFLNSGKEFKLGKSKKGIRVQAGHSVALTAFEAIDFRRETVEQIFPDHDLHGIVSPTTDLSREGIVAPTTQVDAGYHGTLNWTITNTSSEERRFLFKERLFRLAILRLEPGEMPATLYSGDYQDEFGYVRSQRRGAPVGIKDSEWEDSMLEGGPEALLENLIRSGYPWHVLGKRLKIIDQQFKAVSEEYSQIDESMQALSREVHEIRQTQNAASDLVRKVLKEESNSLQNRWLVGTGSIVAAITGVFLSVVSNERALGFVQENGSWIGLLFVVVSVVILLLLARSGTNENS